MADFKELPTVERFINQHLFLTENGRKLVEKSLENPAIPLTDADAIDELFGVNSSSGENVNQDTALSITALWNAVSLISAHFASLPLHVFLRTEEGRKKDNSHLADYILSKRPNEIQTSYDLRRTLMLSALIKGNGFAEIKRNKLYEPTALIFRHPALVEVKASDDLVKYIVKIVNKDGSMVGEREVKAENMIHLKGLSLDGVVGMNVISYHSASLGTGLAQRSLNNEYYANGGQLAGVITGAKNNEQVVQVLKSFSQRYTGKKNRFKTAVLPNPLEYKAVSFTNRDMELLGQMKMTIEDVARIFNIPLHKLKNLDRATNNNIEHQDLEYYKDCLLPWLVSFEQECESKLLTEREKKEGTHFIKHNVNAILRADMVSRSNFYALMRQMKVMSANEVRRLEDMNDYEGGDVYENPSIQTNITQDE